MNREVVVSYKTGDIYIKAGAGGCSFLEEQTHIHVEAGAGVIFQCSATAVNPTERPHYHILKSLVDDLTVDLGLQVRDHS